MKNYFHSAMDQGDSYSQQYPGLSKKVKKGWLTIMLVSCLPLFCQVKLQAQVSVSATMGDMGPTLYTTLKGAFDAINMGTHQGIININIIGNTTETTPAILNGSGSGSSSYTSILIQPNGGLTRTISGTITGGSPLIDLNGADNVTIDGLNTGGNALVISNTTVSSTLGTSTIRFQTDATNNVITHCSILGSATMANGANGGNIWFGSNAMTQGNDNNTISFCDIGPAGSNLPSKCIYLFSNSNTDPGTANSGIIIAHNNIFDFFSATASSSGIDLNSGNSGTVISNNRFYQTSPRTQTNTNNIAHRPININNSNGNNFQIIGNIIGFATNTGTGTYTFVFPATSTNSFVPIFLNAGTTSATSLQGNTIAGIAISGAASGAGTTAPFKGIHVSFGVINIGNITGNTIGSQSTTGSITFVSSTTSPADFICILHSAQAWTSNNNSIGGIIVSNSSSGTTNFYGLRNSTNSAWTCMNNTIGGTIANSIQNTCTAPTAVVNGILISTADATITGNIIRNLTSAGGTAITTGAALSGIVNLSSGAPVTISQNSIHHLTTTGAGSQLNGIAISGGSPILISGNTLSDFTGSGTGTPSVNGVYVSSGQNLSLLNNKLFNFTQTGTFTTGSMIVCGIQCSAGANALIANNLIGDLKAPSVSCSDGIRGILINSSSLGGTFNVYYNTIYLNASSVGANFGSTALYHQANGTSTTGAMDLRNNIIVNTSTASGTGLTVAYRRSGTFLANYLSTSNYNLFYAGTPVSPNFIFHDGSGKQMAAYKALVVPRDASSFTESVSSTPGVFFQSFTSSDPTYLHLVPGLTTQAESGGANVTSPVNDFDADIRQGNGGYAGSGIAPDIGADEFEGIPSDLTGPNTSYTPFLNTLCLTAPSLSAVISDVHGVNTSAGTKPRLWFKKSSNPNLMPATNDNTTDGWKYVEALNNSSPFLFALDYNLLSGGVSSGTTIQYFVVAQDNYGSSNLSINNGAFATPPPSVALNAGAFPVSGTNSYLIPMPLSTSITIGSGGTYPSLTGTGGLFEALNASGLNGNTVATIINNTITENGTVALRPIAYPCDTSFTLTIKPGVGVSTLLSGANTTTLVDFDGADHVILEGSNNGTNSQNIILRNTSGGAVIRFTNGATFNLIKNTILESANTSNSSGIVWFSSSLSNSGNSNNTINNCNIRDRSDLTGVSLTGVFSNGSSDAPNASNIISGCSIFNWTGFGIWILSNGVGNGWTITNSNFYQTTNRTSFLTPISILGGSGHSILNNNIGGSMADRSGPSLKTSSFFSAISLAVGMDPVTNVQGNIISNLDISTGTIQTFKGIVGTSGNIDIGTTAGNIIGGATHAYDTIKTNGNADMIEYTGNGIVNIENNTVGNIANYSNNPNRLIGINGAAGSVNIKNNIIRDLKSSSPDVAFQGYPGGIILSTTVPGANVEGNQIYNISNINTGTTAYVMTGINVIGVSSTGVATNVQNNKIYNFTSVGPGLSGNVPVIWGIRSTSGSATYFNNVIALGAVNTNKVHGFEVISNTENKFYFNSVSITGTVSSGAINSYAFLRSGTALVSILDNIFSNTRSGGTGFHVAIANSNASATGWLSSASNHNVLYSANPANLAQWLGASVDNNRNFSGWLAPQNAGTPGAGGDSSSLSVAPLFISPTDLHLTAANASIDNAGFPAGNIVTDCDAQTRNATTPDIGADEFSTGCTTIVTSTGDSGAGTLRDIISCAPTGATITFDNSLIGQTIHMTSGEININKALILVGPGMLNLTLSGNNASRIFHVLSGNSLKIEQMSLKNATSITNGGAIFTEGTLILKNVLFQNNFENGIPKAMTNTTTSTIDIQGNVEIKN